MSMFTESYSNYNDGVVLEGYDAKNDGGLRIIREAHEDQLEVIKAIYALDMEETHTGVVTESAVSNVWDKVIKFFKRLFDKLKSFFASLVRMMDGILKSGKEFATKYDKQLRDLVNNDKLSGYKLKMVKYHNGNIDGDYLNSHITTVLALCDDVAGKTQFAENDGRETFQKQVRGSLVGKGSLDADDFNDELYGVFRNGAKPSDEPDEIDIDIKSIIDTLKNFKTSNLTNVQRTHLDKIKDNIKKAEDYKKEQIKVEGKNEDNIKTANDWVSKSNIVNTEAIRFFKAWEAAIKDRESDYKRACTKAFSYKKKEN